MFLRLRPTQGVLPAAAALVSLASLVFSVASAQAATYTVTSLNDSGSGSLRQAILDANANPGADTITFGVTGTVTLTSGPLSVTDDLSINGPGAASLTVGGNNNGRVLDIGSGVTASLTGVTIADGLEAGTGAGIYNAGSLTVANATISNNNITFGYGGGIFNGGALTVKDSTFSGNSGNGYGAAIAQLANTTATVTGTTFVGNSSTCTFCYGGAILAAGGSSTMSITNSTFVGNASGYQGGAIYTNATVTVTNSTFSGNSSANGGGIRSEFGNVSLQNSIVANSPAGGNCDATFGVIAGLGNLSWPDLTCPGINQDPQLGPLQSNGGPTATMALPAGSPAIDTAQIATCPPFDQRGVSRPQGAGCDIGSYERIAFSYSFSGFFAPVDNPPTFNRVKAGSGIPVKFSLGGDQGLNIFATGYPTSERVTCDASASLDDVEQTVTAGGSSLSYDSASDRYIYTWKTDKLWAGTCRKLTVRLADGSDHFAYFNFTK